MREQLEYFHRILGAWQAVAGYLGYTLRGSPDAIGPAKEDFGHHRRFRQGRRQPSQRPYKTTPPEETMGSSLA